MDDRAGELRKHASHCRDLAAASHDERLREALQTVAIEFDEEAARIENDPGDETEIAPVIPAS
jgi:hypothetical protein